MRLDTSQTRAVKLLRAWLARWDAAQRENSPAAGSFAETFALADLDALVSAATAPVLRRLEKDLLARQKSLTPYDGLLIVISGPRFGVMYELKHEITTIGRDPGCDVWLNEGTVSRRHAQIHRHGDIFIIRDLNSKNGTRRRNRRLTRESSLRSFDELQIGRQTLLFLQGSDNQEKFQSPRYDSVRSRLIRDIGSETSDIGLWNPDGDDPRSQ